MQAASGDREARATHEQEAPSPAKDSISRSVEVAYQVIEKHIAGGRRAAEHFNSQPYSARPSQDGLQSLLQQMARYQGELIPVWIDLLTNLVKVDSPGGISSAIQKEAAANGGKHEPSSPVTIELISKRPVRVSCELRSNVQSAELGSAGLHAVEAGKPPLTGIELIPDESGRWVKVTITVPDHHPPGRYSGVIVNRESGEIRGTLSIDIAE